MESAEEHLMHLVFVICLARVLVYGECFFNDYAVTLRCLLFFNRYECVQSPRACQSFAEPVNGKAGK